MCNEWTWHLGVWFCSGAGSVMFTVGPDDLNGLFKPKSFYVLMKIFLFLQSGKQTPRKNNCPYSYSNDHVSFFSLEKKADSSFNSIFPPISLLAVTWPCLHCLRKPPGASVCLAGWAQSSNQGTEDTKWNFFKYSRYQDVFK